MSRRKSLQGRLILGFIVVAGWLTLMQTPAYPEAYIAGQFGVTIPNSATDVDLTTIGFPSGTTLSNLDLQTSLMGGVKLGYYSNTIRWFGVETEAFYTTPHVKQQTATITIPTAPGVPGGSAQLGLTGSYLRVITWAPVNLLFRYPGKRFQPYLGIGPGVFFGTHEFAGESQSSTTVGLNTQLGLRYFMSRHWALFGEYKFNYARFNFEETNPGQPIGLDGVKATYSAHIFALGIGYHF